MNDILSFALTSFGFLIRVWEVIDKNEFLKRIEQYSDNDKTASIIDSLKPIGFDYIQRQAGSFNVSFKA